MKNNLDLICKCKGVSGHCSERICWRSAPKFRLVGMRLKEIFDNDKLTLQVKPVLMSSVAEKIPSHLVVQGSNNIKPDKGNLVCMRRSPTYCKKDINLGVPGTFGRQCDRKRTDPLKENSCESLCCGRGYNEREIKRNWDCQCKFYWCCKVACKTCSEQMSIYTCQ